MGAGQSGGPVGVEHHPGGVVAVDDGRLKTGLGKALIGPDEEFVLLAGISHAVGAVVVGHSKVLEQARHLQPRQAAHLQHPGQRRVKVGAERKTDAAHAGVGLEVDFDFSADSAGGLAEGLGLGQGVAGGGDVLLDEDGYTARLHMAQNEDGQRQPGFAQLTGFRQTAHSQPRGPLFSKDLGTLYGTVAVAVGFDDSAQRHLPGPGLHGAEVVAQGVKVYLGPDVFFKCGHLHGLCPPF